MLTRCSCCRRSHLFTRKPSVTWLGTRVLTGDRPAAPPHCPIPPCCSPPLKASLHLPAPHTQGRPLQLPRDVWHRKPWRVEKS